MIWLEASCAVNRCLQLVEVRERNTAFYTTRVMSSYGEMPLWNHETARLNVLYFAPENDIEVMRRSWAMRLSFPMRGHLKSSSRGGMIRNDLGSQMESRIINISIFRK